MSEWYEVKDADDMELSDDGKFVFIMFDTNGFGNRYVEVPVEMLIKLLTNVKLSDKLPPCLHPNKNKHI
jgi:hypothetical protein